MKKIVIALCCLLSFLAIADDCQKACEDSKTNALMGCYYLQQSCIRRFHRETDMEYCIQENLKCIDRADLALTACNLTCEEKNCQTTCESTGMYGFSQAGGMFQDRCYEIIDCAIQSWNTESNKCILERHDERRMGMNCRDIPPAL